MKLAFPLFLLSFAFSIPVLSQTIVTGVVSDFETGVPLPGVNVYISGTTIGASTNENGEFSFSTELVGKNEIVASFIGFKAQIHTIDIGRVATLTYNFSLQPDLFELEEIKVIASNDIFLKRLDLFKTFFIGFDSNANQTYIINPEVLEFEGAINRNRINVSASAPLIIHNNALGYRYEVELKEVYFDTKENTGLYKIYPRVIEMEPNSRRTQRRWNSNRKKSFEGSSRHFFKSLVENRLRRNGFRIVPNEKILVNYSDSLNQIKRWFPSNWNYVSSNFNIYMLNADAVRIEYGVSGNSSINQSTNPIQVSSIDIRGFPEIIIVNKQGLLLNSAQIALFGHWSNTRFSNFLPLDYSN